MVGLAVMQIDKVRGFCGGPFASRMSGIGCKQEVRRMQVGCRQDEPFPPYSGQILYLWFQGINLGKNNKIPAGWRGCKLFNFVRVDRERKPPGL